MIGQLPVSTAHPPPAPTTPAASMLRLSTRALRRARLTAPRNGQMILSRARGQVQSQSRGMGFFSDLKNQLKNEMEKNEELKKSFDELEKTKEKFKNVEKAAKEKMSEMSSMTEDATKSFQEQASQASQKIKESYEETAKAATAAQKEKEDAEAPADKEATGAATQGAEQGEAKKEDGEKPEQADETVEGARAFVKNFFARITAQKDTLIHPSKFPKLRDEWKEAAQELFGKREKQTVDEALASVRTPSMQKPKKSGDEDEEPSEYTGTSALVAVKEEESAWQRVSARFREAPIIQGILDAAKQAAKTEAGKKVQQTTKQVKNKFSDAQEEVLEVWETSQNPWVYRLSSIYDGLFGETPMGVAIKEIRRAEPDFILEEWKENIEEIVLPGVLEAFLRGNSRDLKKWFGEAAYSRVNIAIRERKSEGLVMDPHVLSIDNVEVIEATAEDKQAPIILMRFQAQQINCIRNREGEVVEGSEDEVLAYYYIFAFQRDYDEEQETLRWRIVDLHMQRGGRYY
ncbi:Mitochondrial import inner membrane translocase subunit TIM44 [Phytophthora pseudosyringae]|uniref:Mitochondrial import inner membrane translocase subunit TIM44 n=1 Tax=Phytophthora pseudosyringae TaxID=221518 RepID=A0A8T1VC93_9STRA|nr:Mitochondrial import inner membrane translocase subunit TIM44 [Phytophthora pseudosyringae]